MHPTDAPPINPRDSFGLGAGVALLWSLLQIAIISATMGLGLIFVGLTQLVYIVPLALAAHKRGEKRRLQGILTVAGIVLLLNGICDAVVLPGLTFH